MDGTVLVADDDRTIRTVLTQALTRAGCKVHATSSLVTLMRWVDEGKGDLVISDVVMPDGNGLEQLPKIAERRPGLPVIVISAQNTIMTAIQAAEAEAFDYLPKPFDLPDLMKRASQGLAVKRKAGMVAKPVSFTQTPEELPLVGRTPEMQDLYRLVARVMNTDVPVLIKGESGTGKSLIARTMHALSDRRSMPFITVSGADLMGADALTQVLAKARGGTVLLDGIEDLDASDQARIARIFDTLDENAPRIMSTARPSLLRDLDAGSFREDLYYRLNGVMLNVPVLRERVEDISLLATHFMERLAQGNGAALTLSAGAKDALRGYTWPGNVRQLENVVRRLSLTAHESIVSQAEVDALLNSQPVPQHLATLASDEKLSSSVEVHLRRYFDLHGNELPAPGLYGRILREIEVPLLDIALEATGGNQARCADLLGINRNTLRKKLTELDIHVTRRRKLM